MCDNESVVHVINTQTAKDTWDERCLGYCAQRFLFASEEHYPFSLGNAIFHELRTCQRIVCFVYRSTNSTHCPVVWIQPQPHCQHTFYQRTGYWTSLVIRSEFECHFIKYVSGRPWQILQQFKKDKVKLKAPLFPIPTYTQALLITFLAEQKYAASTVASYISTLSYPHRLASLFDPSKAEMIQLAFRGYRT